MNRWDKLLDLFLLMCFLLAAALLILTAWEVSAVPTGRLDGEFSLVIDPGHGGLDGGAIAFNGVKESEINLAVGLKLRSLAEFFGVRAVMTRESDEVFEDYSRYSEHEDLVRRTEEINSVSNAVLISIHQNFYPTSQPSGAEVLYAPTKGSRELGETTQRNLVTLLQPGNRRLAGPASKSLFITSHITCPGILAECGFLSNQSDLELLTQENYQTSLAAVLLLSYLQFITGDTYT